MTPLGVVVLLVALVCAWKLWRHLVVSANAPVIALSLDTAWHARLGLTTSSYKTALTRVNAQVLNVRPGELTVASVLDQADGLLLCGGGDVDPHLYGGDPAKAHLVDRVRDDFELALIAGAIERELPILGICRGIQILNVAYGGTLRDLHSEPEIHEVHGVGVRSVRAHPVTVTANSLLASIGEPGDRKVSSFHAQAIDQLGEGLMAVAVAADGVIEAIELPGYPFVLAMQWHPELASYSEAEAIALFRRFAEEAGAYKRRKKR